MGFTREARIPTYSMPALRETHLRYQSASLDLYNALFGAMGGSRTPTSKSYFVFKPNMLFPADQALNVLYVQDPFGNSYGYSTIQAAT